MRIWADHVRRMLYIIIPTAFLISFGYAAWYIISEQALLIPREEVYVIKNWKYTDQLEGPKDVTTPLRVDTKGRNVFVFESVMPDTVPEGAVIAFLNRMDLKVEIGGRVVKEWKRDEAPVIGGPAKNSYFVIPVETQDANAKLRITYSGEPFGGKIFDAFVGDKYEVVRYLETKSGRAQFVMSFALLVCSIAIVIAGLILTLVYKYNIKLVLMAMGIFVASSWLVMDSLVLQFILRTQFIDGFMAYITTLFIAFPFAAYLDAIQKHRYKKLYSAVGLLELANLVVFFLLHALRIYDFSASLLYIDLVLAIGIVLCLIVTVIDVKRGNAVSYRYVAFGMLAFLILALVEIVLINTVVERVEGAAIIAGLYILFGFAIVQQVIEIKDIRTERDMAQERGDAKTKFLASMSHEIRTPINSILGMNEMILKESRDPDILNYAGIINDSGTMLLSLINDVLDVSKIDNDMEQLVPVNYDPGKMYDSAAEMLRIQAEKKGLEYKLGRPQNFPPKLFGDEKRISQILTNLISNAVKYTNEGTVVFSGECFPKNNGYELCFYISDTGIGIRNEDIKDIFDPFHRLDLTKNQSIQGTGLGLSIVKSLLDMMNGEIKVESIYGKGSTFSVRIPQQAANTVVPDKYNSGNAVEDDDLKDIDDNYIAPEARILEVDDNLSNQVVVREFLKKTGVLLDIASSGTEALRLCKINKYDVILMDHMMPDPDGIKTMHLIRSEEGSLNLETPQIILTANALMGSRAMYEAEGFDNYLSKPVESVRLIRMIRKYLPDEKVLYRPKKRSAVSGRTGPAPDGPLDVAALLARFDGKQETVNMILEEVIKEGERKIPLLKELAEKEDLKRYAVEAHGIKGVMSSSCAPALSATAKSHELAAKEGNLKFVKENVEGFINEYNSVLDFIREYLKGQEK
ncbi:MAG: response regulator [Lachnospiraceae bacterium]|nr:response regulator [Lachnospiraceae bacterium]